MSAHHADLLARLHDEAERNQRRRHSDRPTITLTEFVAQLRSTGAVA